MTKIHRVLVTLLAILPMAGLFSGGGLAFTMYASSVWFKVEIVAHAREDGHTYALAPTSLALHMPPSGVPFLAGSDHFRRTYDLAPLRNHLGDVASLACRLEEGRAASIEVALIERREASADVERRERVACPH